MFFFLTSHVPASHVHLSCSSCQFAGLHGKPYFWGVFRGQGAVSHQSDYHVRIQTIQERKSSSPNSGYSNGFNLEGSPVTSSSKNSPRKSLRNELMLDVKLTITNQAVHLRNIIPYSSIFHQSNSSAISKDRTTVGSLCI